MKRFLIGLLLMLCITATAFAEGNGMAVITIPGSNGDIYGELQTPAAETFPHAELIVYPGQRHGFMGTSRDDAKEKEAEFFLKAVGE